VRVSGKCCVSKRFTLAVRYQRACGDVPRVKAVVQDGNGRRLHASTTQCAHVSPTSRTLHVRHYHDDSNDYIIIIVTIT